MLQSCATQKQDIMMPLLPYAVLFFDTFPQALSQQEKIREASSRCQQLNVVIQAEGNMDDPALLAIHPHVKVFAGKAWTLIHRRRVEADWYPAGG
jgi:hypothetical protein